MNENPFRVADRIRFERPRKFDPDEARETYRVFSDGREFGRVTRIRTVHYGRACTRWTARNLAGEELKDCAATTRRDAARGLVVLTLSGGAV